jgi:hypothetical protein
MRKIVLITGYSTTVEIFLRWEFQECEMYGVLVSHGSIEVSDKDGSRPDLFTFDVVNEADLVFIAHAMATSGDVLLNTLKGSGCMPKYVVGTSSHPQRAYVDYELPGVITYEEVEKLLKEREVAL